MHLEGVETPEENVIEVLPGNGASIGGALVAVAEESGGANSSSSNQHEIVLPPRHGLRLTFEHVCYTVSPPLSCKRLDPHSNKEILKGVTGEFLPGEMCAIMGPSGSGKTTFLDVVAGRKTQGQLQGTILYGASKPSRQLLRRYVGYVEQHDTLVDTMTVYEMLMYTAALKRPISENRAVKRAIVESLISKLQLETCRNTRIGSPMSRGISGGQAKRVNVALALITDARVLLLDEPTSGLDSSTANEVMQVVKALCKDGTTVAATIHSPTAFCFALFDRLLVLLAGRTVYFGAAGQPMIDYFVGHVGARQPTVGDNLAEWLMDFSISQAKIPGGGDALADAYLNSDPAKATAMSVSDSIYREQERMSRTTSLRTTLHTASVAGGDPAWVDALAGDGAYVTPAWWSLRTLLLHRTCRNYRSMQWVSHRVMHRVMFTTLIVILYWGVAKDITITNIPNIAGLFYTCMTNQMYCCHLYVSNMIQERSLYVREQNDGMYRPTTYLAWKVVDELMLQLLVQLPINCAIFFGCAMQGSFLYFHLMLLSLTLNTIVIGYTFAAYSPSNDFAGSLCNSLATFMLMLCGFLIRESATPVVFRWVVKSNLVHYAWGGLVINQFQGHSSGSLISGVKVLDFYGLGGYNSWLFYSLTIISSIGWGLIAWLGLAYVKPHRR